MRIPDVHRALVRRSQSSNTLVLFTDARARHAALRPFDTPASLVEFLRRNEGHCVQQRSDLVAALLSEVQGGSAADWLALLVLAFFPGLLRLRERLNPRAFAVPDDLTALTFECFCEAAVALPLETQGRCAVLNLMTSTRRRVFRHVRSVHMHHALAAHVDTSFFDRLPSPELNAEQACISREHSTQRGEAAVVAILAEPGVCTCDSDVALAVDAFASGVSLSAWVRREHPHLSEPDLRRTYERLRKRRSRIAARARDVSQRDAALPLSRVREPNASSSNAVGA
jgi:hypothetical protein